MGLPPGKMFDSPFTCISKKKWPVTAHFLRLMSHIIATLSKNEDNLKNEDDLKNDADNPN